MKWVKPNGNELETNDSKATIEYCESLGFEPVKEKRTRRTKEQIAADEAKENDSGN